MKRSLMLLVVVVLSSASLRAQEKPTPLTADTPQMTVLGNTFIAPAGWRVSVKGPTTILEAPEGDSWLALVDTPAKDAEAALAAAWAAYKPDAKWPLKLATDQPDRDGWSKQRNYDYQTSPNERRDVSVGVRFGGGNWTAVIYDMAQGTGEKRLGQVVLVLGQLLPKGYSRESFAGKETHPLDKARLAELKRFVESGRKELGIPGVALGIVQDGKVVFAGGFGVRALGQSKPVDGVGKRGQFLQCEVWLAELQPVLGTANGQSGPQRQAGGGELVQAEVQLFGRRLGCGGLAGPKWQSPDQQASEETNHVFDFHARSF